MTQATFARAERLSSRKVIDQLFKKGSTDGKQPAARTFYLFPFRLLYPALPAPEPVNLVVPATPSTLPAVLITVSKRTFKRAVDRNRIRRRIREAYRLHKTLLLGTDESPKAPPPYIIFIYTVKTEISFSDIEKGMKMVLTKIN